jgi:hypothetical protein
MIKICRHVETDQVNTKVYGTSLRRNCLSGWLKYFQQKLRHFLQLFLPLPLFRLSLQPSVLHFPGLPPFSLQGRAAGLLLDDRGQQEVVVGYARIELKRYLLDFFL